MRTRLLLEMSVFLAMLEIFTQSKSTEKELASEQAIARQLWAEGSVSDYHILLPSHPYYRIFFIGGGFGSDGSRSIHILDTDATPDIQQSSPPCTENMLVPPPLSAPVHTLNYVSNVECHSDSLLL